MPRFTSATIRRVPPSDLERMWRRAVQLESQGRKIIHFEIGRPDFDTPAPIKEAAKRALDRGLVHYTLPRGIPELRAAIAQDMARRLKVDYDPETEILVTVGAVEGIFNTLLAVLGPGDEVLIPEPMYPLYVGWAEFLGGRTVGFPCGPEEDYQIIYDRLAERVTTRTKLLVLNTPRNPTGTGFSEASLAVAARVAQERDLLVISDEVYDRIVYAPFVHRSIAARPGMKARTVVINTFSKTFAMDGWRVGWLAAPAELLAEIDKAHLRTSTCAASLAQWAALEALRRGDELFQPMLERYTLRRDFIVDLIQATPGLTCRRPEGTFYVWLGYGERKMGDAAVADYLLDEAGVAVCPGNSFGPSARGHCRVSFASDRPTLEAGITRLSQALGRLAD